MFMLPPRRDPSLTWVTTKWFLLWIPLLALLIDLTCALWLWGPQGVSRMEKLVSDDIARISASGIRLALPIKVRDALYDGLFGATGADAALRGYAAPAPSAQIQEPDFVREMVKVCWPVIITSMMGLALYALRLGVLVLSLPLFLLIGAAAVVDGGAARILRRGGGGIESTDLYHTFKRLLAFVIIGACAFYLCWPYPLDPRWVILPAALFFGCFLRGVVAFYKKYL